MIYAKLLKLQEKSVTLKKDAQNPFFKSSYITLDNILETYLPLLNELKLMCYHYTKDNKLITEIIDTEDETRVSSEFNILNTDPQKAGSEITYGKRYGLGQLLNIQTDIDDDGNKASSSGNTQEYYKKEEDNNLPWFNDENYDKLSDLIAEGQTFTIKQVRDKYKVSKANAEKLKSLGIT